MKSVTVFDRITGLVKVNFSGPKEAVLVDGIEVPGFYSFDHYRLDLEAMEIVPRTELLPIEVEVEEIKVRAHRNRLLSESDWVELPSAASRIDISEWFAYRQQLRDLPSEEGFPFTVVWPTKPLVKTL